MATYTQMRPYRQVLDTHSVESREEFAGTIVVKSQPAGVSHVPKTQQVTAPAVQLKLIGNSPNTVLPKSVMFQMGGVTYIDRSGVLYKDVSTSTNAGTAVGTIDYETGTAVINSYTGGSAGSATLISCLSMANGFTTSNVVFRTSGAPLRPASLQISAVRADTGAVVTATSDLNGSIEGGIIKGYVDYQTGIVKLRFTTDIEDLSGASDIAVIPTLIRYNAVAQSQLPLDADLIGLNPVRLPSDGRVPVYRDGDVVVLHNTKETVVVSPSAGGTLDLLRTGLAYVEVVDDNGLLMNPARYSVNLETGILTWGTPLVLETAEAAALTLPLTVRDRVEHMSLVTDVEITGEVSLSSAIPWDLPTAGTYLSSAVAWGDLQALITNWFTQQTWNGASPNWTNAPIGGITTAQYNSLAYPPIITNVGAIEGKWAIVFTGSTSYNVVEQNLGVIATGSTSVDCAPVNAMTGHPYFTIRKEGWGSGWASGNAVRFNTSACLGPMWVIRTVVSGIGVVTDDAFKLQVRGDAD